MEKELSKEREQELRLHLQTKIFVKLHPQQIKRLVKIVNSIRRGEISVHDYLPRFDKVVRYFDMLESFAIEPWLSG